MTDLTDGKLENHTTSDRGQTESSETTTYTPRTEEQNTTSKQKTRQTTKRKPRHSQTMAVHEKVLNNRSTNITRGARNKCEDADKIRDQPHAQQWKTKQQVTEATQSHLNTTCKHHPDTQEGVQTHPTNHMALDTPAV